MSDIEERVKKIVVEHLGVEEAKIKSDSKFIDDLGATAWTVELVMALKKSLDVKYLMMLQKKLLH